MPFELTVVSGLLVAVAVGASNPVFGLLAFLAMAYTGFNTDYYGLIITVAFVGLLFKFVQGGAGGTVGEDA